MHMCASKVETEKRKETFCLKRKSMNRSRIKRGEGTWRDRYFIPEVTVKLLLSLWFLKIDYRALN